MELNDAIQLIQSTALQRNQPTRWADLGCGAGLFTRALSYFLRPGSLVYAVDKSRPVKAISAMNKVQVERLQLDFIKDELPFNDLHGVVMANALHYVQDKNAFIDKLKTLIQPGGIFLLVEYDTDDAIPVWVPYPISYRSLGRLFRSHGYARMEKLRERASVYGHANLYAAVIYS